MTQSTSSKGRIRLVESRAELIAPLVRAMAEGVVILNHDGRVIECNPAAEQILGYTRAELEGRHSGDPRWSVIREDGSEFPSAEHPALVTLTTGEARSQVVMGVLRPDGSRIWIRVNSQPILDGAGQVEAVLTAFSDITELRRTESALRESEARFRNMADDAPMPISLSDRQGRREFFNLRWHEFAGLPSFGLHGEDWRALVHPDDLPGLDAALARGRETRSPASVEFRLRTRDNLDSWFLEHTTPHFGSSGELAGFVGIALDINARRRGEETIRKLSQALEQSAARIVITDESGRIEYVNPACCAAYGYSAAELIGENPRLFKSGQTPPAVYEELWKSLLAGQTWRGEITNKTRSGATVIESATISPVRDEHGRTRHYVAVKEDISSQRAASLAQRELDARLAKLERMRTLNTLASGVAHDFNNILVAILGFSDLGARLLRGGGDPQRVVSYLEEIRSAGERARLLVKQLLAFGRASELRLGEVHLPELVADAMILLEPSLPDGISIECRLPDDLPRLTLDGSAIQQVILNLCLNARDAMPAGGVIRIEGWREELSQPLVCDSCQRDFRGEQVCIEVADEGSGIAPALRANIFEPFFTTKDLGQGSGMGLSVVHGTVHQYDGHVCVLSGAEGGTRMRIYLPVNSPQLAADEHAG